MPIVPTVPMTPTRWLRVAPIRARTPGSMTPMTGTGSAAVQLVQRGRGGRVARDDDSLDPERVDEGAPDLECEVAHLGLRTGPVGVPTGVTDVHEMLVGKQVDDGPSNGEAAEPAVEHPDRAVVGHLGEATGDAARFSVVKAVISVGLRPPRDPAGGQK